MGDIAGAILSKRLVKRGPEDRCAQSRVATAQTHGHAKTQGRLSIVEGGHARTQDWTHRHGVALRVAYLRDHFVEAGAGLIARNRCHIEKRSRFPTHLSKGVTSPVCRSPAIRRWITLGADTPTCAQRAPRRIA